MPHLAIPSVTTEHLDRFRLNHFSSPQHSHFCDSFIWQEPHAHAPAYDVSESEGIDHDEQGDSLGFYPDGVKRTLTDEQIAMFRFSEVQNLLKMKRAREEKKREKKRERKLRKKQITQERVSSIMTADGIMPTTDVSSSSTPDKYQKDRLEATIWNSQASSSLRASVANEGDATNKAETPSNCTDENIHVPEKTFLWPVL